MAGTARDRKNALGRNHYHLVQTMRKGEAVEIDRRGLLWVGERMATAWQQASLNTLLEGGYVIGDRETPPILFKLTDKAEEIEKPPYVPKQTSVYLGEQGVRLRRLVFLNRLIYDLYGGDEEIGLSVLLQDIGDGKIELVPKEKLTPRPYRNRWKNR